MKPIQVGLIRSNSGEYSGKVTMHVNMAKLSQEAVLIIPDWPEVAVILNRADIFIFPQSPPNAWLAIRPIESGSVRHPAVSLHRVLRAISKGCLHLELNQIALNLARGRELNLRGMFSDVAPWSRLDEEELKQIDDTAKKKLEVRSALECLVEIFESGETPGEDWMKKFHRAIDPI